jgi:Na+/H+-dicarboxylate symporter/ABC-type amino acid transport substrate-binding protein
MVETAKRARRRRPFRFERRPLSFTAWIFTGLGLGVGLGLFLGEYAERLRIIGDVYIGLMEMTVLPYIVFSLIGNIGRLNPRELRVLAGAGLATFLGLWALAALTVLIIGRSFPDLHTGAFFSAALVDPPPRVDFLSLFVPSNPFRALADNAVPAVVIFCLLFGVAIVGFEEKKPLLDHFTIIARTLHKVNALIVKLTPVGVFGIAAAAAGTMTVEEFGRLQGYYLAFFACMALLTFGMLPLLVTVATPFTYRQVLVASKDALVTAFATGSVFPVIPLLVDGVQSLFEEHFRSDPKHADFPDFILPLAYPFPDSGNVIDLVFVPFAAWFLGNVLSLGEQLYMLGTGFFLLFGKVYLTIPFLLRSFQIPQDMFQLFLAAGVIVARVGDVLSSMHYLVFTVLATAFMTGLLRFHWGRLFRVGVFILALMLAVTAAIRMILHSDGAAGYEKDSVIAGMQLLESDVEVTILPQATPNPDALRPGENRLERIIRRGRLRVGFIRDRMPYSYFNGQGQLVGFDVDLMHKLADDLGVGIEFVPYEVSQLEEELEEDHFDLAISGLTDTLERSVTMLMSEPYLVVNMALVVPDHRREQFSTEQKVNRLGPLRVGVGKGSYFARRAHEHFPNLHIVELDSYRRFFEDSSLELDALITDAEGGSAWTLVYPHYVVVNPLQRRDSASLAFPIAGRDLVLEEMLKTWINQKKMDGTMDALFDHWMLGKLRNSTPPRWSIIRDVLHWVD